VPNLYAALAYSKNALGTYLALQSAKTSLRAKEKEIINLVVSQVNACDYCLAAHTAIAKLNGFTDSQILEIRAGEVSFDPKFNALAAFVKSASGNHGKPSQQVLENFFAAGYTEENLVDTIMMIGDKTITNYLYKSIQVPIDWPAAQPLEKEIA
jgi:AhpD family alkylhydroperoxidase